MHTRETNRKVPYWLSTDSMMVCKFPHHYVHCVLLISWHIQSLSLSNSNAFWGLDTTAQVTCKQKRENMPKTDHNRSHCRSHSLSANDQRTQTIVRGDYLDWAYLSRRWQLCHLFTLLITTLSSSSVYMYNVHARQILWVQHINKSLV